MKRVVIDGPMTSAKMTKGLAHDLDRDPQMKGSLWKIKMMNI